MPPPPLSSAPRSPKLARAALILPIASLAIMQSPLLLLLFGDVASPGPLANVAAFAGLAGLLISIPFGAIVAWTGRKWDRRRVEFGIIGCSIGFALTTLTGMAMYHAVQKAKEIQSNRQQTTDYQSIPER